MIIKARINGEGGKMYKLCEWNTIDFAENPQLRLQTDNLSEVKEVFKNISKIEIFQANTPICEYVIYDTYSSIGYLGNVYVQHENIFADCLEVKLTKSSLAEQVKRIQDMLDENVDIDSMGINEYKDYMLKKINEKCTEDIQAGVTIDGQLFTYKHEDQQNLLQLYLITKMYPQVTHMPYHSSGNACTFYSKEQIQKIYMTLVVRLLRLTTYANQLNLYIKSLTSKEEIQNVYYGMSLPDPYATVVSTIVEQTNEMINEFVGD